MPASPMRRRQSGRRLRSGVQLAGQQGVEEEWCPATTFAFPESPPLLQPERPEKMVVTKERKLRRQTMMPRKTATADDSPPLSQRRTRRQSMMPVKLRVSPKQDSKSRVARAKPSALPPADSTTRAKSKRKLAEEIVTLEASPSTKRRRLIPTSKSNTQMKTQASPPASRKHKSLSALPVPRSGRQAQQSTKPASPPARKAPAPPAESSRRKTPARKRALSPAQPSPEKAAPSPPKRRAAARSKSASRVVRGKSLPRSQSKSSTAQKSKSSVHIKSPASPAAKKLAPSPRVKPSKKTSSASPKAPGSSATKPSPKTAAASPTPKTPPAAAPRSTRKSSVRRVSKKALSTPAKTPPASNKRTPTAKSPPSGKRRTPTIKSPPSASKKTSTGAKTPPAIKKTPTVKTPPARGHTLKSTPVVVLKKVKSPQAEVAKTPSSEKKQSVTSVKISSPATSPPQKRRLIRSTAKSHMTSTKSVRVVVSGKSPPSSLASFRKTPSSRRALAASSSSEDLGASPDLPSARKQLQKIRNNIASAHERRRNASATPRKSLLRSTTKASESKLDKVVTQADIHAPAIDKDDTEDTVANHCDSFLPLATPSARPPLPSTPKSSRSTRVRVCHFSSSVASSSTSVKHFSEGVAPHSSTPIKGNHTLEVIDGKGSEDTTTLSVSMDDSLGVTSQETTVEESVNGVGEDTSMEESVEEPVEPEPPTQSRRSYCSLM